MNDAPEDRELRPAVLRLLVELCAQFVGAEEGSLLIVDDADDPPQALRFAMTVGSRESERALVGQRVPLGEGVVGLAAVTHEVQMGAPTYAGIVQARKGEADALASVLAAPVLAHDELLGVITAVRFAPGAPFEPKDALLYGRAAAVAGVVLDQARRLALANDTSGIARSGDARVLASLAALDDPDAIERDAIAGVLEALAGRVRSGR